jgi:hypothetical protein
VHIGCVASRAKGSFDGADSPYGTDGIVGPIPTPVCVQDLAGVRWVFARDQPAPVLVSSGEHPVHLGSVEKLGRKLVDNYAGIEYLKG